MLEKEEKKKKDTYFNFGGSYVSWTPFDGFLLPSLVVAVVVVVVEPVVGKLEESQLVIDTGNPRVFPAIPGPVPDDTHTQ